MEDLVLVRKVSIGERIKGNPNSGRPVRSVFALRKYSKSNFILAFPTNLAQQGDCAEFYVSSTGFAVQITPEGSRKLTGKKGAYTANIPTEMRERLQGAPDGSSDLICDERPDRLYFFPFSQFAAA